MTQQEIDSICQQAVDKWGTIPQSDMAIEEMAELTNALMKDRRGRVTLDDIITEVADVTIMMNQLSYIVGRDKVQAEVERKIVRLKGRLEKNQRNGDATIG